MGVIFSVVSFADAAKLSRFAPVVFQCKDRTPNVDDFADAIVRVGVQHSIQHAEYFFAEYFG